MYIFGIIAFLIVYLMIVVEKENDEDNDKNH